MPSSMTTGIPADFAIHRFFRQLENHQPTLFGQRIDGAKELADPKDGFLLVEFQFPAADAGKKIAGGIPAAFAVDTLDRNIQYGEDGARFGLFLANTAPHPVHETE